MISIPPQRVWETTVQQRQQFHSTSLADVNKRCHLATDREGSCEKVLCLGINNTVSGCLGGGGFGVGLPEAACCVTVEFEEGLSTPRSRITASRLAYFLASCGSIGSVYLCLLGADSSGGLVRGTGLGTIVFVIVIMPDF